MNSLFECKVSYERQGNGGLERVTEGYLVDALSFTEAEARIIEEIKPFVGMGELEVKGVQKRTFADTFLSELDKDDKFYRIKVVHTIWNERTSKEQKKAEAVLIQAESLTSAVQKLEEEYGELENYEIHTVTEMNILDLFKYKMD